MRRDSYAVVLSPEFYWSKKVSLPVKKAKDALKLAPSVFEGFLPKGEFSYAARKMDDDFIMIAYDKKQIATDLEKILPYKSDIAEIYFAQDALSHIVECTAINGKAALSNHEGLIIQVPRVCTNTQHTMADMLENATLDKYKIKLSSFDNALLSPGDVKILVILFGLLFTGLMSEYVIYKGAASALEEKRSDIIKRYDLPRTSIQLKSIKKSLLKKYEAQKALRDRLALFSDMQLKSGEYIQSIEETVKDIEIKVQLLSKDREKELMQSFPSTLVIQERDFKDNMLTLRIRS